MARVPDMSPELELLYQAMGARIGIAVKTTDVLNGRARLYGARAAAGDPELSRLQIRKSLLLEEDVLWIVKGPETKAPNPAPTTETPNAP